MKRLFLRAASLVLLLALGTACSQTTLIKTKPEGATVWVNLVRLGDAPARFETRTGVPGVARVKVDLEGYQPVRDFPIEKSYHADLTLLWLIPGILPYFFTARFEDEVVIPLKALPKAGKNDKSGG